MKVYKLADLRGLLLIVLIFSVLLGACGNNANSNISSTQKSPQSKEPQTSTVKHFFGETKIPRHPKRVAVFGLEDIALSLGIPMVYAYDFKGYYLDDRLKKLNISLSNSADFKPNLEAILAASPDLILVQAYSVDKKGYDELSKIAPTVAFEPDAWKATIKELGKVLGIESKAEDVIQARDKKAKEAKEKIINAVGPDKTMIFMRPSDKDLQVFFPSFNFAYHDLGLKPDKSIAKFQKESSDDWGINTSLEMLPSITADYVFTIYGGSISTEEDYQKAEAAAPEVEKLQVWKAMPAVKQNHVFKVSARHWMSSGPIAESMEMDDVVKAVTGE